MQKQLDTQGQHAGMQRLLLHLASLMGRSVYWYLYFHFALDMQTSALLHAEQRSGRQRCLPFCQGLLAPPVPHQDQQHSAQGDSGGEQEDQRPSVAR